MNDKNNFSFKLLEETCSFIYFEHLNTSNSTATPSILLKCQNLLSAYIYSHYTDKPSFKTFVSQLNLDLI